MQDWAATAKHVVTWKGRQRWKAYKKADYNEPKDKMHLLTVDFINILIISRNIDTKIMQPIRIASESPTRIRKWDQFTQFRWAFASIMFLGKI